MFRFGRPYARDYGESHSPSIRSVGRRGQNKLRLVHETDGALAWDEEGRGRRVAAPGGTDVVRVRTGSALPAAAHASRPRSPHECISAPSLRDGGVLPGRAVALGPAVMPRGCLHAVHDGRLVDLAPVDLAQNAVSRRAVPSVAQNFWSSEQRSKSAS